MNNGFVNRHKQLCFKCDNPWPIGTQELTNNQICHPWIHVELVLCGFCFLFTSLSLTLVIHHSSCNDLRLAIGISLYVKLVCNATSVATQKANSNAFSKMCKSEVYSREYCYNERIQIGPDSSHLINKYVKETELD